MRSASILLACAGVALLGWMAAASAAPGSSPVSAFTPQNFGCGAQGPCESTLLKNWIFYGDQPRSLMERDRRAKEWDQAEARKQSEKLVAALSLPCELVNAVRAGGGKIKVDGRSIDVKIYEVACRSGIGYFLVSQPPEKSMAVSCFAAEAALESNAQQGSSHDGFTCSLSGDKDIKAIAASVVKTAGKTCDVRDYHWIGISSTSGIEYSEVACESGQGYVLELPKTGAPTQVSIVGCQDAVSQGVKCKLTAVTMPVTLETFRDALKEHAVDCADAQMRYIGRETQGRRYVVELQCPQKPAGVVAFIPLEGNTKPFETLDCATAATRSAVQCKLTTAKQ